MEHIPRFLRGFSIPRKDALKRAFETFNKKEKILFFVFFCMLLVSTVLFLKKINDLYLVNVPSYGGTLEEGMIGPPRFINPLLAISDTDKDLTSIIYSGLMKKTVDGDIVPDLANEYTVSPDGLTYTFIISPTAVFHDGTKVTANDVAFTVNHAKDPLIKSPKRVSWEGVTVEATDEATVTFTLKQPYISFLENTTLGVLPAHAWEGVTADEFNYSDLNTSPIGSGPYEVKKVSKRTTGVPDSYTLRAFDKYTGGKPYIRTFIFNFYGSERDLVQAVADKSIDQAGALSPEEAINITDDHYSIKSVPLPRIFGLFFNQSQSPIFTDKHVVDAFNAAIDKNKIINQVLLGYGTPIDSPLPVNFLNDGTLATAHGADLATAASILEKAGWKKGDDGFYAKKDAKGNATPLSFSISTGDAPELASVAESIKQDLTALGVEVDIKTYEIGSLNQNIIRPRKYDALLFGEVVSHESDLFAFWHSSQRNDPGLNVALYTNAKVDKTLEDLLTTKEKADRIALYKKFQTDIASDARVIFLYAPEFIYVTDPDLHNFSLERITTPQERFLGIEHWYTDTEKVWKVFTPKSN